MYILFLGMSSEQELDRSPSLIRDRETCSPYIAGDSPASPGEIHGNEYPQEIDKHGQDTHRYPDFCPFLTGDSHFAG